MNAHAWFFRFVAAASLTFLAASCQPNATAARSEQIDPTKLDSVQKQIALNAAYPVHVGRYQLVSSAGDVVLVDTHNGDSWILRDRDAPAPHWQLIPHAEGPLGDLKKSIEETRERQKSLGLTP